MAFNEPYPYVNVSLGINNLSNYPPPQNPLMGQHYVDIYGTLQIFDGHTWVKPNNNNYYSPISMGMNNIYGNDTTYICDDGSVLHIGKTLERIKKHLGIIEPNNELIEKYPAVKEAFDNYQQEFSKMLDVMFPDLKFAIESYNTVVALVKMEESNGNDI